MYLLKELGIFIIFEDFASDISLVGADLTVKASEGPWIAKSVYFPNVPLQKLVHTSDILISFQVGIVSAYAIAMV